jgi:hypothetical protein
MLLGSPFVDKDSQAREARYSGAVCELELSHRNTYESLKYHNSSVTEHKHGNESGILGSSQTEHEEKTSTAEYQGDFTSSPVLFELESPCPRKPCAFVTVNKLKRSRTALEERNDAVEVSRLITSLDRAD